MADVRIVLERNLEAMASGRECFDYGVTPLIRPQVARLSPELRQAWWDGLLAGLVEAMVITIGEKATIDVCQDLFTRSKDAKADVDRALAQMRSAKW
jgi:hypothetical protein